MAPYFLFSCAHLWLISPTAQIQEVYSMVTSIKIYPPLVDFVEYTIGAEGCTNIVVHFYFANVVHVVIYLDGPIVINYYQCPCIYTVDSTP
jgi:hypothetical protein